MNKTTPQIQLLHETIEKQVALCENDLFWFREIPDRCPPVLWFGKAEPRNRPILTMSANPSRQEFLKKQWGRPDYERTNSLKYLKSPRFYLFDSKLETRNITTQSLEAIINSYQQYFSREDNAYSYFAPVELFLNNMNASFYTQPDYYRALHIDLIPFVTLSDFTKVESHIAISLFRDGWGQRHFRRLVNILKPTSIIIFGESNVNFFNRWFQTKLQKAQTFILDSWTEKKEPQTKPLEITIKLVSIENVDIPILQIEKYLGGVRNKISDEDISALGRQCIQYIK